MTESPRDARRGIDTIKAESRKRKAEENSLAYPLSAFGFPLSALENDHMITSNNFTTVARKFR